MPIIKAELKFYKSATVSDGSTNGGRMSATPITSGAVNNLFEAAGETERAAGSLKYRKIFMKVENDADLTLFDGKVFLDKNTPGDDRHSFFPGTQTDTQASISGSERQYGGGNLDQNVSALDTTLDVLVETGNTAVFQDGDLIRITDKQTLEGAGNEEFVTISGAPSILGDVVTLTFTPALANGYSASVSRVQSVYSPGNVKTVVDNLQVTSASGTFNINNLLGDNISTVEQTWTLTFTSPTAFTISGNTLGSQGSGSVGGGAAPNNPNFTKPYFVMQAAGFGGTFAINDTIVFQTHPASVPIWLKKTVPNGATVQGNNTSSMVLKGETAG
jgi:hypothetical protein